MKNILCALAVVYLSFAPGVSLTAHAVSYSVLQEHRQVRDKAVMQTGTILYLFHSGTPDIKKTISINDILIVYRETPSCELKEVGKIKVLSSSGDNFIKAAVVEGEVKHDDIAKKGTVSFLVVLSDDKCK